MYPRLNDHRHPVTSTRTFMTVRHNNIRHEIFWGEDLISQPAGPEIDHGRNLNFHEK